MQEPATLTTDKRQWDYAPYRLATNSTIVGSNGDQITVTVYQDVDGDGTADTTQTITLSGGEETHALDGFDQQRETDVWMHIEIRTDTDASGNLVGDPVLHEAELVEPENMIAGLLVDANGTVLPGSDVYATNQSTDETYSAVSDSDGKYEIAVPAGEYAVGMLYDYDDGTTVETYTLGLYETTVAGSDTL